MNKILLFTVVTLFCGLCITITSCQQALSQHCIGCICHASSLCDASHGCQGDICGPFQITYGYWADAGKPSIQNSNGQFQQNEASAYSDCANDISCAAQALQGYMQRYEQDCNGDQAITCEDYLAIHKLGRFGCTGALPNWYSERYNQCKNTNPLL